MVLTFFIVLTVPNEVRFAAFQNPPNSRVIKCMESKGLIREANSHVLGGKSSRNERGNKKLYINEVKR